MVQKHDHLQEPTILYHNVQIILSNHCLSSSFVNAANLKQRHFLQQQQKHVVSCNAQGKDYFNRSLDWHSWI